MFKDFQVAEAHCDIPCKIYDPAISQVAALSVIRLIDLLHEIDESDNSLKSSYIEEFNINTILSIDFNEIKEYSAEFFCEQILIKKLNTKYLVIGRNFKFGKNREGDINKLKEYHDKGHFELIMPELEQYDNKNISSTRIRSLLKEGNLSEAKECLGKNYELHGIVTSGEKLGRKLGYPTANIALNHNYPLNGIYLSTIMINGKYHSALSSLSLIHI